MVKTAIELDDDLYLFLEVLAQAQGLSTSAFAQQLLRNQVDGLYGSVSETSRRDLGAFHRELPRLLEKHAGQYAAFYNGSLVGLGTDRSTLLKEMQDKYGNVEMLVTEVAKKRRVWHIPYWRRVR
jgi:hypothetical protein